jgi:hypothetical protein
VLDDFDVTDSARALVQLDQAHGQLEALRDAAPGEVKDDLSVLIDLIDRLQSATKQVDPAKPETARAAIEPLKDDFGKADDANTNLETYRETTCQPGATPSTAEG